MAENTTAPLFCIIDYDKIRRRRRRRRRRTQTAETFVPVQLFIKRCRKSALEKGQLQRKKIKYCGDIDAAVDLRLLIFFLTIDTTRICNPYHLIHVWIRVLSRQRLFPNQAPIAVSDSPNPSSLSLSLFVPAPSPLSSLLSSFPAVVIQIYRRNWKCSPFPFQIIAGSHCVQF